MASSDFTALTGILGTGDASRGVTEGAASVPNGGGTFVYGVRSKTVTPGVVASFHNGASFAPMASGGRVDGAMMRAGGGGDTGYAPVLFLGLQGVNTTDNGYFLGFTDDLEPAKLILKKGKLSDGMASNDGGILRTSTDSFEKLVWRHFRLDMIVQPAGDVLLQVFQNDLTANAVTSPSWVAVDGMADFVDDALGTATGSAPYTSGRGGFGFWVEDVNRTAYVDHITMARQV